MSMNNGGDMTDQVKQDVQQTADTVNTARNVGRNAKKLKGAAGAAKSKIGAAAGKAAGAAAKAGKATIFKPLLIGLGIFFLLFTLLSWINPFSSTNTTTGDNENAQDNDFFDDPKNKDINPEELSDEELDLELMSYTLDDQYKVMAEILRSEAAESYEEASKKYDEKLKEHSENPEYNTHSDFSGSKTIYQDPSTGDFYRRYYEDPVLDEEGFIIGYELRFEEEDKVEPRGKKFISEYNKSDHATAIDPNTGEERYLAPTTGITYAIAAYSVSRGNTSPVSVTEDDAKKYAYYSNFRKMVKEVADTGRFFEYTDSILTERKRITLDVVRFEEAEILEKDNRDVSNTRFVPAGAVEEDFEYDEVKYYGSVDAFNVRALIEKMFLDNNPFYEDIVGKDAWNNSAGGPGAAFLSGGVTGEASEILKQLKAEWPEKMDPRRVQVVEQAMSGIGKIRYYWGGGHDGSFKEPLPGGLDCSGFVSWVYYHVGINLGRDDAPRARDFRKLSGVNAGPLNHSKLLPGDIVDSFHHVGIYGGTINGKPVWIHSSGNRSNDIKNPGIGPCTKPYSGFNVVSRPKIFNDNQSWKTSSSDMGGPSPGDGNINVTPPMGEGADDSAVREDKDGNFRDDTTFGRFTNYTTLTNDHILKLARLCVQEQGPTARGVANEASLMANLFESYRGDPYRRKHPNDHGKALYEYVRYSTWFNNSIAFMDTPRSDVTQEHLDIVRSVLVNGKRALPTYVDEHDCFSDIISVKNDGVEFDKYDKSKYVKDKTVITNGMGAIYIFWTWGNDSSQADPFGYQNRNERERGSDGTYSYGEGSSSGVGVDSYNRAALLRKVYESPYYQWSVVYEYDCECEGECDCKSRFEKSEDGNCRSTELSCPSCGAPVKTKKSGFLFWRKEHAVFEYEKAEKPDMYSKMIINENGELEEQVDAEITVREKIDYYADDIYESIDEAKFYDAGGFNVDSMLKDQGYGGTYIPGVGWVSGTAQGSYEAQKLIDIAKTYVGQNGQAVWDWHGAKIEWCAAFVTMCAEKAGLIGQGSVTNSTTETAFGKGGLIPNHLSPKMGARAFVRKGQFQYTRNNYVPRPGDIAYFSWDHGGMNAGIDGIQHVEIVVSSSDDGKRITCIGGNTGAGTLDTRKVKLQTRSYKNIVGYGTPAYKSTSDLAGGSVAEQIFRFFVSRGYTREAAAAICGNLSVEAGTNSSGDIKTDSTESTGEGIGIVQWSSGRKKAFLAFAASRGESHPGVSLKTQLEYMELELNNDQWLWGSIGREYSRKYKNNYNITLSEFKRMTNVDEATIAFCANFERPHERHSHMKRRQKYARDCLAKY